jgi:hypothetical protein
MRSAHPTSTAPAIRSARWWASVAGAGLAAAAIAIAGGPGEAAVAKTSARCGKVERGTRDGERLIGTRRDDLLRGRGGHDRLSGLGSADCLRGGSGADEIKGGPGGDGISAGSGSDRVNIRDGSRDVVHCGGGRDRVKVDRLDVLRGCEQVLGAPATKGPGGVGKCSFDPATLTAAGCRQISSDTAATPDAASLWGQVECETESRHELVSSGGDPHLTALGASQGNDAYRRLSVFDGDDWAGERCELGRNDNRHGEDGGKGTFALYKEGQHRITFASLRIESSLPADTSSWQTVLQMKQAQPASASGDGPVLELQLRNGRYYLDHPAGSYWSTPATSGVWQRVVLDIRYSQDPNLGSVRMYIDANGDGDVADPGEQGPQVRAATLKAETEGPIADNIAPGNSIPSHLRTGVYHDTSVNCATGCSIDVDNVQVVG